MVGEGVGEGEGDWEESREGVREVQVSHVLLLPFPRGGHFVST